MIHVFVGTIAEYIKVIPLLKQLEERGVPYDLIDTGQHRELLNKLQEELKIRSPDIIVAKRHRFPSLIWGIKWILEVSLQLIFPKRWIQSTVSNNTKSLGLIIGDSISTLFSLFLAKKAGLKVAYIEGGLRSYSYWHPFPEEFIRCYIPKKADIIFAASDIAYFNLIKRTRIRNPVINMKASLNLDTIKISMAYSKKIPLDFGHFILVVIRRWETLVNPFKIKRLIKLILFLASQQIPVVFIVYPHMEVKLKKIKCYDALQAHRNILVLPFMSYEKFIALLSNADCVLTDSGNIQEECYYLGIPCLVLRKCTERMMGLNKNVFIMKFNFHQILSFIKTLKQRDRKVKLPGISPSKIIIDSLKKFGYI